MSKTRKLSRKSLVKRTEAIVLAAALAVSGFSYPSQVNAADLSTSWKTDIESALDNVLSGMDSQQSYEDALGNLSDSLNGLESAATVEGLAVTEVGEDYVTIEWESFDSDELLGYNVYWADKDTETQVFSKLTSEGKKTEDDSVLTISGDVTTFTYHKSTSAHHYFKVAPVLANGEGSKTEAVKSPTAKEFDAYLENLDRGLVAVETTEGVFLSWRLLGTEVTGYSATGLTGTDFNVYQSGVFVAQVTDSTNYVVAGGTSESDYTVVPVENGVEVSDKASSNAVFMDATEGAGYLDIALQAPHDTTIEEVYGISTDDVTLLTNDRTDTYTTTTITYSANDVSVGDVDGDGEYEFFVKWDPSLSKDVSQQGYTGKQYIDCYELDGTLLYRIDLGINIRAGAHYTQFVVYDLNEDGKAEIYMKTAPGTKVIKFNNNDQDDVASETYITTPDGESNDADYVYSAEDYREHLIEMFMDWGVWAEDTPDMIEAKEGWDSNLINLFAPEDGTVTVVTGSDGVYTSSTVSREEAGFTEDDVLVNVPVRDESGNVVYKGTGAANAYMETVKYDDPKTGISTETYHEGGYTRAEAEELADYFLNGYQYRMKKHNLNNYEGYIISGSEYLTAFDGETGNELDTIMYEFAREDDGMLWGDYAMNYMEPGNRCDRFLATVAYLDGENPYLVMARGYYTRQTIATYSLNSEGKFEIYWTIDSGWTVMTNPFNDGPHGMNGNNEETGTNGIPFSVFTGQGDHYVSAADVDGDGCQEIIYGGAIVDNNGDVYSSGGDYLPDGTTWSKYGHGDSIHVTDIDPDRAGLEIFSCFEGGAGAPYGTALRDAETNEAIPGYFSVYTGADTGRCMIGDILPGIRGIETWGVNTTDSKGNIVAANTIGTNQNIRWSADMTTQLYTGNIEKCTGTGKTTVLTATGTSSNNGTKGNAALIADLFGDWREELVVRTSDSSALRIYTNTEVTDHKLYTLMHNIQYRANVAGQSTAYNQPAYTDFYLASDTDWEYVTNPNQTKDQEPGIVEVQASGVSINCSTITVKEGSVKTLTAEVTPAKATDKTVTWSVEDETVAVIDENGNVTGVKAGTTYAVATTSNGITAKCKIIVKEMYVEDGSDVFAVGDTKEFTFGTVGQDGTVLVGASDTYSEENGYGFDNADTITLAEGENFVSGNNSRTEGTSTTTYDYPTFVLDVPVGIYEVTIEQGSDDEASVVGAYVEGNMYSVRWSTENFATSFAEPSESSYIVTAKGSRKVSTVTTAVADGQLTINLATAIKDDGTSLTTFVNSIKVKRVQQNLTESENPTLRFIGDSTVATYPPEDGNDWTPIPERTGWGSEFAMSQFMDDSVVLVNKAVAGSSIKSYVSDGYYNDFFLNSNPGDTVIIEGGINDSATGRRYVDAVSYEEYLRYFIDSCKAFGLDVILSSGTSSGSTYVTVQQKLAEEYGIPYVALLDEYNAYKSTLSSTLQSDLTVDGTHLSRVGGVIAAQIVASSIKELEGYSISGHVVCESINENAPTAVVSGVHVKAQTEGSVTIAWDIDEDTLYAPDQLITRFNIYRKAKGEADSKYEKTGEQRAYVSASMSGPKLYTTIETPESGEYEYAVTVVGLKGEGAKSESVVVGEFTPTSRYELAELTDKFKNQQMYDASHYSVSSYAALETVLAEADAVLANTDATETEIQDVLAKLNAAADALELNVTESVKDDFQSQAIGSTWDTTGNKLLSVIITDDGNRLANAYVEAAGTRNIGKPLTGVESDVLSVEFEWLPGQPDTRNCTEIQFSDNSGVYFALKTSNNGHIGYVVGQYPSDSTDYLTGDGFHEGNTYATDCGLSNDIWYNVRIVFDYTAHTADLYLIPRDDEDAEAKVIKDIAISEDATEVTLMNFLCMRGKQDNGVTNDLSVLWDTYLDNFEICYTDAKEDVNTEAYNSAVNAFEIKTENINQASFNDDCQLALIVKDIMSKDAGFFKQADYDYAAQVMEKAADSADALITAEGISCESTLAVTAGLTEEVEISLVPENANEIISASSKNKNVAVVSEVDGYTVKVTGVKAGTTEVTVQTNSGVTAVISVTVTGTSYLFGTDTIAAYTEESGYGFSDFTYPEEAVGYVDGVYYRRSLHKVPGTSYTDVSESAKDYIAVNGTVWTENAGSRDEDAIRYENTSSFDVDLEDGNYRVSVILTNPESSDMTVNVLAEDITRYSSGDHETSELVNTVVYANQTVVKTFDVAVIDGQLNLRFEQDATGTSLESAYNKTVYVKGISIVEIEKEDETDVPAIYVLGDSTVQTYTQTGYRTGWGQVLYSIFEGATDESVIKETSTGYAEYLTSTVAVKNYARDARSAKSFKEEGRLNEVLLNVEEGDFVLAQFTHNDSNKDRTNRYLSEEEFRQYLIDYNNAVTERGGTFVMVTPIALNVCSEDGEWDHRFESYRLVMLELSEEMDIPVLDLMGSSYALLNELGSENVSALSMYMSDTVHLQKTGADMYTKLLSNLINAYSKDSKLDTLKSSLKEDSQVLSYASESAEVAVNETISPELSFTGEAEECKFYSSDETVAVVDENGSITGVSNGTAVIMAAVTEAGENLADTTVYTTYCVVTVTGAAQVNAMRTMSRASVLSMETYADDSTTSNVQIDLNADIEDMMPQAMMKFDFGSKSGATTGFINITNNAYSSETGYGFISDTSLINYVALGAGVGVKENPTDDETALTAACSDAIRAENFEFAIDLPQGTYMLTIYKNVDWNITMYQASTYTVNGVSVNGITTTAETTDVIADSVKVTLDEPGQVVIAGINSGKLAILNAVVVSTYVEEVKSYDADAFTTLRKDIKELEVKMSLMSDDSTPLDFDASLVNKLLKVKADLKAVKGMPFIDTDSAADLKAAADEALANKNIYTEKSIAALEEALNALAQIEEASSGSKEIVVAAISAIDYWLDGVDTENVPEAYSLYVDFDYPANSEYLTEGYVSVLNTQVYDETTGYGLLTSANGRNRGAGSSLYDDFVMDNTFAVKLPAGSYNMRAVCGDLLANASNTSKFTITNSATEEVLLSGVSVAAAGGEVNSVDMSFELSEEAVVNIAFSGRLNALLIEQDVDITVAQADISVLQALVDEIEAAGLEEGNYTVSSWETLTTALADAKEVIENGVSYTQQFTNVYNALKNAYEGLIPKNLDREILIDFGTETSAVSADSKFEGDGGIETLKTGVIQGLPTMLYEETMTDNGQHFGFDREVEANETASGGAHFRDYVYSTGGKAYTFSMDVPVGTYYVYMYTGDKLSDNTTKFYFADNCEVTATTNTAVSSLDEKTVYTQTSSGGGQFSAPGAIYTVEVKESDTACGYTGYKMGKLSVTIFDDGAAADAITARLNGIEITPVDKDAALVPDEEEVHVHSYVETDRVEATCTEDGYVEYTCECGESYKEVLTAAGHDEGEWVTITEAGLTTDGERNLVCTKCGEVLQTEVIPSLFSQVTVAEEMTVYAGTVFTPEMVLPEGMTSSDVTVKYSSSSYFTAMTSCFTNDIIALKAGTAVITTKVTCNGETKTFTTNVTVKYPGITITNGNIQMTKGETITLETVSEGLNGTNKWVSLNPFVVKVNSNGEVTALRKGTAYVTVFNGIYYDTIKIVVK